VSLRLPESLAQKVLTFPESSMGAHRVTLVLADGRQIHDGHLAWGEEIVRIGSRDVVECGDLGFDPTSAVDALPEANS